jgi:hypothetical protein
MGLYEEQLSELFGDALLDPSSDELTEERSVVDALVEAVTRGNVIAFVGYAFGHGESSDTAATIAAAGSEHMSKWTGGDLLCRRLAAITLIRLLESYTGPPVLAAALAVGAAGFTRQEPAIRQLSNVAAPALTRLADHARNVAFDHLPDIAAPSKTKSGDLPPEDATPLTNQTVRPYVQKLRAVVRDTADATEKRVAKLERLAWRTSEEIDLLWWGLRPTAPDGSRWADLGGASTFTAALEVAHRMLTDPPLRGTDLILRDALSKAGTDPDESIGWPALIQSTPDTVLGAELIAGDRLTWSQPVLSALRARRGSPGQVPPLSGDPVIPRLQWAMQLVEDLSLERVLK